MIRKIVIAIACFTAIGLTAQDGTVSPYSYFGVGELKAAGSVENQMMGGVSTYADSIHLNLNNPAAYSQLRLTAYGAGISYKQLSLKSAAEKESSSVTTLEYLSLGFPIGKGVGVGLGLQPFSSVGYNLLSESEIFHSDNTTSNVVNQYSGTGGLNRVYLSIGYAITKNLSVGVTGNYNFGKIEHSQVQVIEDRQLGTEEFRSSRIGGADFNFSLNYNVAVKEKYTLYTSARINTQANLSSRNTQQNSSFNPSTGGEIESDDVNLANLGLEETDLKMPATTTLGVGFGQNKKWFLGGEYSFQELSSFSNAFVTIDRFTYKDASSIAFGGYFIPDYNSYGSFLKRVTYRAGVRMVKTGMVVRDQEIDDFGITFGVGLPLAFGASSFSNINIGFEIGKRGTTEANLIEENYFKINVGLSLNDKWFKKRKIN